MALTRQTFVGKVIFLLVNMLSRSVIIFLPRSKHLLISWLQSPSAVILEPQKNKVWHCFPIYLPWSDGTRCHDLSFQMLSFKPTFSLSSFTFIKRLFSFRKGRETRDQIANIPWIIEKAREFQKNIYFCFIDNAKAFDCVDHNKLWKILKEMGIPDHLTCLLRNLYPGQEATVRTGHGTTDWFQIGKGVHQGCIFSPCIFNLYAEYIMRNAGLEEAQAGIKISRRNINNLRYADDTTLMAESNSNRGEAG